ncbi:MAG: M14 family zinc carboxypeptidase [candidate division WOR-3 bacterium]|nr:M14 family zinc carboxypeptidase [candidate division WOR-3 bacterium]
MKKILLIGIFSLGLNLSLANLTLNRTDLDVLREEKARTEMLMPSRLDLVRIEIVNPEQVKIFDQMGVIINKVRDNYCIAEATPDMISDLIRKGYKITTLQENISGMYYENFFTKAERGRYLTYTEFVDTMHIIAINNASFCKLETLGLSHNNRLILAMKISDSVAIDEPEPAVYFDGNIHGDEKIGWAVCFEFIKYLITNYPTNATVTYLINNREIWLVPMINPDGYVSSSRYNGRQVDLNRNFGWMWGNESACGSDAFSENEATAFYNLFVRQPFVVYTTYHAGDSVISNPWSYTTYDSVPEKFLIWHLAQGYSQRGNNYPYGQGSLIMYTINGSSKDYCYGVAGEVSWSIEVHNIKTPPASAIDPTFNINRDAMLYLIHNAGKGIHGFVTDSITGEPLYAQIWVLPRNWLSYSSPTNGDFHRFYLPGNYTLKVRSPGYEEKTLNVTVPDSRDSSININIRLNPISNPTNFGMRVVATRFVTTSSNRTYPVRALGVRDTVGYQLDNTKWIIIDMWKPIQNVPGNDFTIYRSSGTGSAVVKVSNNWKGPWTQIGTANSAQSSFDLASVSFDSVRYIRLESNGNFVFDAIENFSVTSIETSAPILDVQNEYNLKIVPSISSSPIIYCVHPKEQEIKLIIYNSLGQVIKTITVSKGQSSICQIPISNLKTGVYFVKINGMENTFSRFTIIR